MNLIRIVCWNILNLALTQSHKFLLSAYKVKGFILRGKWFYYLLQKNVAMQACFSSLKSLRTPTEPTKIFWFRFFRFSEGYI